MIPGHVANKCILRWMPVWVPVFTHQVKES